VPRWATAGTSLDVKVKDEKIGQLALVSLKTLSLMDIERLSVAVFELDADKLFSAETCLGKYVPLPKFPCVKYELALLFDEDVKWDKIAALASAFHRDVRSVSFVDEYRGEQIEKGKKSLALELTFENPEKTLTSEDVQKVVDGLLIKFESDLGGTLRGR
jgi:phenylalanyl-tRNA synthetase beta chain